MGLRYFTMTARLPDLDKTVLGYRNGFIQFVLVPAVLYQDKWNSLSIVMLVVSLAGLAENLNSFFGRKLIV